MLHKATIIRDTDAEIEVAVAAERERCANIAETWKSPLRPGTEARLLGHQEAAREIAAAIRNPTSYAAMPRATYKFTDEEIAAVMRENDRLRVFAASFGRCSCEPGMCDPKTDFQCRAREALDGHPNTK